MNNHGNANSRAFREDSLVPPPDIDIKHAMLWITPPCAKVTGRAKPETAMTDVSQWPKSKNELWIKREGVT